MNSNKVVFFIVPSDFLAMINIEDCPADSPSCTFAQP